MRCPKCDTVNLEGALFCSLCYHSFQSENSISEPYTIGNKSAKPHSRKIWVTATILICLIGFSYLLIKTRQNTTVKQFTQINAISKIPVKKLLLIDKNKAIENFILKVDRSFDIKGSVYKNKLPNSFPGDFPVDLPIVKPKPSSVEFEVVNRTGKAFIVNWETALDREAVFDNYKTGLLKQNFKLTREFDVLTFYKDKTEGGYIYSKNFSDKNIVVVVLFKDMSNETREGLIPIIAELKDY